MGLRGPSPKPTAIRQMEGNPAKRPLPKNEPQYAPGLPVKPRRMSPAARIVWDELVSEMASASVLRRVDARALWQLAEDEAILASAYSGMWKMARSIKNDAKAKGMELKADEVWVLLMQKAGRLAFCSLSNIAARVIIERREFGLTPSSRSRIDANADDAGGMDPIEMKLCG